MHLTGGWVHWPVEGEGLVSGTESPHDSSRPSPHAHTRTEGSLDAARVLWLVWLGEVSAGVAVTQR